MSKKVKIIYIIGHERSGSTLLHNILGQSKEMEALGELRHFWKRIVDNGDCGCGKKADKCERWSPVFSNVSGFPLRQKKHKLERFSPILVVPGIQFLLRVLWRKHFAFLRSFYGYLMNSSDATYLVDSSKSMLHFFILAKCLKFEVTTIQILRNPLGVEYSLFKRKHKGMDDYVNHNYIWSSLFSDFRYFFFRLILSRFSKQALTVKYEDVVDNYHDTFHSLFRDLGIKDSVPSLEEGTIDLKPTHTIGGSPSRFKYGKVTLGLDNSWKENLPDEIKRKVKSISFIHRRFYN